MAFLSPAFRAATPCRSCFASSSSALLHTHAPKLPQDLAHPLRRADPAPPPPTRGHTRKTFGAGLDAGPGLISTPRIHVLFENQSVLVVNKPPGAAVQGEEASEAALRWQYIRQECEKRYGTLLPVHRLDKSTSGPLIFARSPGVARTLSSAFQNGEVKKSYLALVQYLPGKDAPLVNGEVRGELKCRMRNRKDKMALCDPHRVDPDCKDSSTGYELITATGLHALVRLTPHTGRKHQLRLHCSRLLKAPIIGDYKYDFRFLKDSTRKHVEGFLKREDEGRIMLHASSVEFALYAPKRYTVQASAPLPRDFRVLCDQLDLDTSMLDRY